jgi:KDO2-lipid IV(A) lauroyltransferase
VEGRPALGSHLFLSGLLRALSALFGLWPRSFTLGLGRVLGRAGYALGIRRRVALDNLTLALPELSASERRAIARRAYGNLGAGLLDFLALPSLRDDEVFGLLDFEGYDIYERAAREGKGVVVATAHTGAWELMAAAMARKGHPVHLVTRTLRGAVNQHLVATRARSGLIEIPARGALAAGVAALRQGAVVANLLDQNMLLRRGIFVDFFGHPACTTPAASLMARRSGAPTIVALAEQLPDGRARLTFEGPFPLPRTGHSAADVHAHTQQLVSVLEAHIRRRPDQWLWLHRRWKTQKPTA